MLRIFNDVVPISSILFSNEVLSDGTVDLYHGNLFSSRKRREDNNPNLFWMSSTSYSDVFAIMDNNDDLFLVNSFTSSTRGFEVNLSKYVPDQYVIYMCKERSISENEVSMNLNTHGDGLLYYVTRMDICGLLPEEYTHAKFNNTIINKSTDSNNTDNIILDIDRVLLKLYKE
jgi:hypothetical protein